MKRFCTVRQTPPIVTRSRGDTATRFALASLPPRRPSAALSSDSRVPRIANPSSNLAGCSYFLPARHEFTDEGALIVSRRNARRTFARVFRTNSRCAALLHLLVVPFGRYRGLNSIPRSHCGPGRACFVGAARNIRCILNARVDTCPHSSRQSVLASDAASTLEPAALRYTLICP